MFDKTSDLYVKACVIQNGVTDTQGDTLDKVAIKQIFTSFNNQNSFDIYHDGIPVQGITLLENYISSNNEQIGRTLVPSGSWNILMRVTCPELQERILNGEFHGVSLGSRIKDNCTCELSGQVRYQDLDSAECVIPLYISLVDEGANGVGLEIYDYNNYINKSRTGSVKLNIVEELKALIQRAEDEPADPVEEPVITKADDSTDEEPSTDSTDEEQDVEKECDEEDDAKVEKTAEDEPAITDLVARIEALEKIVKELKPSEEAEVTKEDDKATTDEKEDEEQDVAPVITKSAKVVITEEVTETKNNFYEMTGRDPITGKKL